MASASSVIIHDMTVEAALIISGVILIVTVVVIGAVVANRRRAARDEEMTRQAKMRGWSFEVLKEGGYDIQRWKGNTNGVEWVAESRFMRGRRSHGSVRAATWRATSARGPEAPILCLSMASGQQAHMVKMAQGDGLLANLAKKAAGYAFDKVLDLYFGETIGNEVDASVLKPVPGTPPQGFMVMAQDVDAAARILFQGLSRALAAEPQGEDAGMHKNTWVLLWKNGVALGQSSMIDSIEEIDRLSRLGFAIARVPIA
jgi:hypothetical protein